MMKVQNGSIHAEWQERIKNCENSSLTIKCFCKSNNISATQFYKWRKRLKTSEIVPQQFIEVKPEVSTESGLRFDFGNGAKLIVDRGFDKITFQQLMSVLGSC